MGTFLSLLVKGLTWLAENPEILQDVSAVVTKIVAAHEAKQTN